MNVEIINIDGEPFQVNTFYKESDQLNESIERMIDKNGETSEVLFSGYMMNCTMVFNQMKRSIYSKLCHAIKNISEFDGQLCYVPYGNACFRKCLEYIYKRDFSNEYKEIIQNSDGCKTI